MMNWFKGLTSKPKAPNPQPTPSTTTAATTAATTTAPPSASAHASSASAPAASVSASSSNDVVKKDNVANQLGSIVLQAAGLNNAHLTVDNQASISDADTLSSDPEEAKEQVTKIVKMLADEVWSESMEKQDDEAFHRVIEEIKKGGWDRAGAYVTQSIEIEIGLGELGDETEKRSLIKVEGEMTQELATALDLDTQSLHDAIDKVCEETKADIECQFDICLGYEADNTINPKVFDIHQVPLSLLDHPRLKEKLIYLTFWASWSIPCQARLSLIERQLEKIQQDEKLKNSVVFAALSIDDDINNLQSFVKRSNSNIVHLWTGAEGWDSESAEMFNVSSIPLSFIINNYGVVVWSGMPSEIDNVLEDTLRAYISSDSSKQSNSALTPEFRKRDTFGSQRVSERGFQASAKPLTQFSSDKIRKTIIQGLVTRITHINNLKKGSDPITALITIEKEWHPSKGKEGDSNTSSSKSNDISSEITTIKNIYVSGGVFEEDTQLFNEMGDWLDDHVANVGWTGCRHLIRPDTLTPSTKNCVECGDKVNRSQTVYVCLICDKSKESDSVVHGFHRTHCEKCENSNGTPNQAPKHDSTHVVCVVPPGNVDLSSLRYGPNTVRVTHLHQEQLVKKSTMHPDILCDGCGSPVYGVRYKNLVQDDHDLCQECFNKLNRADPHQRGEIAEDFGCQAWDVFAKIHTPGCVFITNERDLLLQYEKFDQEVIEELAAIKKNAPAESKSEIPVVSKAIASSATTAPAIIPLGHTKFSWSWNSEYPGLGHTAFTMTG